MANPANPNFSPYRRYNDFWENPTVHDHHTHQGEHGNTSTDVLPVDILSHYQEGDKIALDEFVWDHTWTSIKLIGEHCPGLEVDLGMRDLDSGVDYPTLFGQGIQPDTIGIAPAPAALPATGMPATGYRSHELLEVPFRQHEDINFGLRTMLFATINGTITNGDRFWVVAQRIFIGNN